MHRMMDHLYQWFKPLVEARWFTMIMDVVIFANPLAILPQVVVVLTASSVEGIALPMWFIFAAIQAAFVSHGIKSKSSSIFLSMLVSFMESVVIIIAVLVRS